MGVCWTMVWWRIAAETPASAPRCSAAERAYIEHALAIEQAATKKAGTKKAGKLGLGACERLVTRAAGRERATGRGTAKE